MRSWTCGLFALGLVACGAGGSNPGDAGMTEGTGGAGTGGAGDMMAGGSGGSPVSPATGCSVNSLVANCGFESPALPAGGTQTFSVGETFSGWKVVGVQGNVTLMSASYADMGFQWSSHDGAQMLNLAGTSRTATGVSQDVPTTPGTSYNLSLWLGNIVDATGYYGVYGAVKVLIDGVEVLLAMNPDGEHMTVLLWEPFTVQFTATKDATTISFINDDSIVDNSNIIDDIVLTAM